MSKRYEHFSRECIQKASKPTKRCSTSFAIWELQIKHITQIFTYRNINIYVYVNELLCFLALPAENT